MCAPSGSAPQSARACSNQDSARERSRTAACALPSCTAYAETPRAGRGDVRDGGEIAQRPDRIAAAHGFGFQDDGLFGVVLRPVFAAFEQFERGVVPRRAQRDARVTKRFGDDRGDLPHSLQSASFPTFRTAPALSGAGAVGAAFGSFPLAVSTSPPGVV